MPSIVMYFCFKNGCSSVFLQKLLIPFNFLHCLPRLSTSCKYVIMIYRRKLLTASKRFTCSKLKKKQNALTNLFSIDIIKPILQYTYTWKTWLKIIFVWKKKKLKLFTPNWICSKDINKKSPPQKKNLEIIYYLM